jgi:hypothetical protein
MPQDQVEYLSSRLQQIIESAQPTLFILLGAGAVTPFAPGVPELTGRALQYAERHARPIGISSGPIELASLETAQPGMQDQKIREYSEALHSVQQVRGPDGVRAIVQEAALHAYESSRSWTADDGPLLDDKFREFEHDVNSWRLPEGLLSLADIVRNHSRSIGQYVLTTNFDPLIEVGLRRAGVGVRTFALVQDGAAPVGYRPANASEKIVLHLHGDCYGRTLHTPWSLAKSRPRLESWLSSILESTTLLVVGYSGWDDVVHHVLEKKLESAPSFEVLWAVYEDQEEHAHINPRLAEFFAANAVNVTAYYGVDRDQLFNVLLDRLRSTGGTAPTAPHRRVPNSSVYNFARELSTQYKFGISHLKNDANPKLVFWPHRLRKTHLIHGVHALAAILLTRLDLKVELHLDDTHMASARADELSQEFSDAVQAWFGVCGVEQLPSIIRTSDLLRSADETDSATSAHLWRLARDFFSPTATTFDVLLATKTIDPSQQSFVAPRSPAHHMLRPLYTWLALELSVRRHDLDPGEPGQILTLGGEDEQKMWDAWHSRVSAQPIGNLYVPRLETPATGKDLWQYQELWRDAPFSGLDIERFTLRMAQSGGDGEFVLEWIFESALRLAIAASRGSIGGMQYGGTNIASWGEALDAIRKDPLGGARALGAAVSQWFHADA